MKNTSKPPFLLKDPDEQPLPSPGFLLAAAVIVIALFGFAGRLDYAEAAREECAAKHMQYDPENDVCFVEHKPRIRNNPKDPRNGTTAEGR